MNNEQQIDNNQKNQELLTNKELDQPLPDKAMSAATRRLMSTQLRNKIMTFIFLPVILGITISSGISTVFTMLLTDRYSSYANIQLLHQMPAVLRSTNVLQSTFLQQQLQSQVMKLQKIYDYLIDVQNGNAKIKNKNKLDLFYNAREIQNNQSYNLQGTSNALDPSYSTGMWFYNSTIENFLTLVSQFPIIDDQMENISNLFQIIRPISKNSSFANRVYFTLSSGIQFIFPAIRDQKFANISYEPLQDQAYKQTIDNYVYKSQILSFIFDQNKNQITTCFVIKQFSPFTGCVDIVNQHYCGIMCIESLYMQENFNLLLPTINKLNLTAQLVNGYSQQQTVTYSTNHSWNNQNFTSELFGYNRLYSDKDIQNFQNQIGSYAFAINSFKNQPFVYHFYQDQQQLNQISQSQITFDITGGISGKWADVNGNYYVWATSLINLIYQDNIYNSLKDILQNNYYVQIGVISGMFLLLTYISWKQVKQVSFQITESLSDLLEKVQGIEADDLQIDVMVNFKESSQEVNRLYETFNDINVVLRCANDDYFVGNEASQLINYSNAIKLFEKTLNNKGLGIAYNNIGNIHMNHNRTDEAIKCYREAVKLVEDELKQQLKVDSLEAQYGVQPINGWENLKVVKKYQLEGQQSIQDNKIFINNKTKVALEQLYANRLYQLSNAFIESAKHENEPEIKKKIIDEIIDKLHMVEKIDSSHDKTKSREIKVKVKLCNAFLQRGELRQEENSYVESFNYIEKAEQQLKHYEKIYSLFLEEDGKDDPPDILMQDILLQHGYFCEVVGKFREACRIYTNSIVVGRVYEPSIRSQALLHLRNIFEKQDMIKQVPNIKMLISQIEKKKNKDIVFVLDYSQSMEEGSRKKYALVQFLDIFDKYLEDEDRVAYVRFNQNVDIVFELCDKGCNTFYLRKFIGDSIDIIASGETALYQAIYESYKLFKKCQVKDHQKWILVVTDGQDNASQINSDLLRDLLQKADINLIIVGIMLSKYVAPQLNDLCSYSNKNAFIQNILTQDIHIAFQSITNLIFGKLPEERYIVEKFA